MRAAAIVNPRAGGGAAGRRWQRVAGMVEERLGAVEVCFTESPGHATLLADKLAAAGFDPVIAAGGDGTLNEVANGILSGAHEVRVGVLPLASGGDFARTMGLTGLPHAVEVLAAGRARPVDAVLARFSRRGNIVERFFVNAASIGLGAEVAQSMGGWCRVLPRSARYLAVAVQKVAVSRGHHVRLWLDGVKTAGCRVITIALANGRYQGGGILIAPEARLDDGALDVTLVEYLGLAELARNVNLLYSGAIYSHAKVRHWRAARVRAEAASEAPLELDGEPVGTLPLEVEVRPQALRLIRPSRLP